MRKYFQSERIWNIRNIFIVVVICIIFTSQSNGQQQPADEEEEDVEEEVTDEYEEETTLDDEYYVDEEDSVPSSTTSKPRPKSTSLSTSRSTLTTTLRSTSARPSTRPYKEQRKGKTFASSLPPKSPTRGLRFLWDFFTTTASTGTTTTVATLPSGVSDLLFDAVKMNESLVGSGLAVMAADLIPYQVSVKDKYFKHFCSGSIISDYWVISAAICVTGELLPKPKYISAAVNDPQEWGYTTEVSEQYAHPKFNKRTMSFDIGLIKVTYPFPFIKGTNIFKVTLSAFAPDFASSGRISGWGWSIKEYKNLPKLLRAVPVKVISNERCKICYGPSKAGDKSFCVGERYGNIAVSICVADPGTPFIHVWTGYLEGIATNIGLRKCSPLYPAVYTPVVIAKDWIIATTGTKFSDGARRDNKEDKKEDKKEENIEDNEENSKDNNSEDSKEEDKDDSYEK